MWSMRHTPRRGLSCDVTVDACDIGLSCFKGTCRAQAQRGAECAHWPDCAFPNVCLGDGICGSPLQAGERCTSSLDCTTLEGCDVGTKLCAPVRFGQPGAACDGEVTLCESGDCDRALGTCPAVLADGAACDPTDPASVCRVYSYCFQGTCQIVDGASCR
jgi:hypothetical protein